MDLFRALRTRRSIRQFTAEPVSDDDLHAIMDAAMHAPSARNEQPWHFVIVKGQEGREALAKTSPYTHMAAQAPVVIVVCGDLTYDKANGMWVQDCAAATQNILLAARGKELASVWCGVHPHKDREDIVRAALGIPEGIIPFSLVCIGHSNEPFNEAQRFHEDRIRREKW